jgi:hypothetical protein
MRNIESGIEKLFQVVKHSAKFETSGDKNNFEDLYTGYLSELKIVENNLHKQYCK